MRSAWPTNWQLTSVSRIWLDTSFQRAIHRDVVGSHLKVEDRDGQTVFESGRLQASGLIIGNDNDNDPSQYEPHYEENHFRGSSADL